MEDNTLKQRLQNIADKIENEDNSITARTNLQQIVHEFENFEFTDKLEEQVKDIVSKGSEIREDYDQKIKELQEEYNVEEDTNRGEEGFTFVIENKEYHSDWVAERVTSDDEEEKLSINEHEEGPAYEYANQKTNHWMDAMEEMTDFIENRTEFTHKYNGMPGFDQYEGTDFLKDYRLVTSLVPTSLDDIKIRKQQRLELGTAKQVFN